MQYEVSTLRLIQLLISYSLYQRTIIIRLYFIQVSFNMLEIYSEQVRDLLNPTTIKSKGGLKVRENPTKGFYGTSIRLCLG